MFVVTVAIISRLVSASRPAAAIRSPVSSGAGFVWGGVVHMQSPLLLKFLSHKIKNKGSKKMNWVEVVPRGRRGTSSSDTSGGQVRTNARVLFYDAGVMASPFMLCRHVWCWRRRCFPLCVSLFCGVKGIKTDHASAKADPVHKEPIGSPETRLLPVVNQTADTRQAVQSHLRSRVNTASYRSSFTDFQQPDSQQSR